MPHTRDEDDDHHHEEPVCHLSTRRSRAAASPSPCTPTSPSSPSLSPLHRTWSYFLNLSLFFSFPEISERRSFNKFQSWLKQLPGVGLSWGLIGKLITPPLLEDQSWRIMKRRNYLVIIIRVGKCHGYGGYIRVKKLASWGKKFGRPK